MTNINIGNKIRELRKKKGITQEGLASVLSVSPQAVRHNANTSTTENFYAHIIEENKAKASECIADVLLRKKA